jgi:hypothetical protein
MQSLIVAKPAVVRYPSRREDATTLCFGVSLLAVESHVEGTDSRYTNSFSGGELMLSLFAITGLRVCWL